MRDASLAADDDADGGAVIGDADDGAGSVEGSDAYCVVVLVLR